MKRRLLSSAIAGFVSGLLVLGIGGRVLMRALASFTPEDPRYTWIGTLQIVGMGAAWGFSTGPLILMTKRTLQKAWLIGPVFGLLVFVLAAIPFMIFSGFSGEIVAPSKFLWLSAVSFPVLFALHGLLVNKLHSRPASDEIGVLGE